MIRAYGIAQDGAILPHGRWTAVPCLLKPLALAQDREEKRLSDADRADIAAVLRGDDEAYARLVRRYENVLGRYMWRFTRDRVTWEELVHDVFVEAYLSLPSFRGEAPWLHWLRKIATRIGYRYWRRQARERGRGHCGLEAYRDVLAAPETAPDPGWAAEALHAVLAQLPPRDRLVLSLFYLEEMSVEECAQATGWSQTMVKVQCHRARKKLRKKLEEQGLEVD